MNNPESTRDATSVVAEFSRELMRLYARAFGRGPTRAKASINDEHAVVILEEIMTPAEHTLVEAGNQEHVVATRLALQEAVREDFNEIAERITGRKVRAFFSQVHLASDMAAEVFVFEDGNHQLEANSDAKNQR